MIKELDNYIITDFISNCNDGAIYKAVDPFFPQTSFAIRVVPNELISPSKFLALEKETSILQTVTHENIIKLKSTRITKKHYCLVFEYCAHGSLDSFLKANQSISEGLLRHIIRQVASALETLHSLNIVHNNLSLSNLLLVKEGGRLKVKLADFRSAQLVNPKGHDFQYDILDMGCVLQKLICGDSQNNFGYLPKRLGLSEDCLDFLRNCFQITTKKDFSLKNAKQHPFIEMREEEKRSESGEWLLVELDRSEEEFELVEVMEEE
eukprot:TRINITY_DN9486_c0_g1_i1.p1 TRINITY_DN9486_c0_g1~~TRINITY_DN9486_c0_g1_i1.p1  ORF type:complete len:265 (+),score=69.94 TRINITY_DN9486_c0_g1_i1:108-902(+)